MRFISDQMVPEGIVDFLGDRGHEVLAVRDHLSPKASDLAIAQAANALAAIVITWNVKHFQKVICRAPRGEHIRFRNAGLLSMYGPEAKGLPRMRQSIEVIEFEFGHLQTLPDKRFFVEIDSVGIRIVR